MLTNQRLIMSERAPWPELPLDPWQDTRLLVHAVTQMLGKLRLAKAPSVNHWWHVTLQLTPRGLTTLTIPEGAGSFEVELDVVEHALLLHCNDARRGRLSLQNTSIADFYRRFVALLRDAGIKPSIWPVPVEVPNPVPFLDDVALRRYDRGQAERFFRVLANSALVMQEFRGRFLGKASPVHFFWGSFDLVASRFSGQKAPLHPSIPGLPDAITREAYSHEVCSCGFWPGEPTIFPEAMYYSYCYAEPPGYKDHPGRPADAYYHPTLGEYVLPYSAVQKAADPEATLLAFLQWTYEAAADNAGWDRAALERSFL